MSDRRTKANAKRSQRLDSACYDFANEFIAFQVARLRDAVHRYHDPENRQDVFDQKAMGQMALSVRNAQSIGRLALGESQSSEKKQLELDLGEQARNLSYDELANRIKAIATTEPMRTILADALGAASSKTL